jgi:hypothetical protein
VGDQGPRVVPHRARLAAARAGLLGGQGPGLLLQQAGQGALRHAAGGGRGDLLKGQQVHVQARARVPEGPPRHEFAPLGGQVTDILEFLGR